MVHSEQTVSRLTPSDEAQMAKQRALLEVYLGDADSRKNYQSAAGKLGLLRALLQQEVFQAHQTYELQCMGIVLGDAFVQAWQLQWVMVEDDYGRDPAVKLEGTTRILFPLTMISKRVERGEEVDVFELFNGVAEQLEQM